MDVGETRIAAREREQLFGLRPERSVRRGLANVYGMVMAFLIGGLALLLPEAAAALTYVVDDPGNSSGRMTLARAISLANQHAGPDTITFAPSIANNTIGGSLAVTDSLTIDGGSRTPIGIDFSAAKRGKDGFTLDSAKGGIRLRGLAIFGARGTAIRLVGGGNDAFTRDWIGFRPDGRLSPNGGAGIVLGGTGNNTIGGIGNNTIGGSASTDSVYVGGNATDGLDLASPSNLVHGAFIGFGPDGAMRLNGGGAVVASTGAVSNEVSDNEIASAGTAIRFPDARNLVRGNSLSFSPASLAVDVGGAGRTPNSPHSPTNFPLIGAAAITSGGSTVDGSVDVAPNARGEVQIYDQSQSGGLTLDVPFGGASKFMTDSAGKARFHISTSRVLKHGHMLVAFQDSTSQAGSAASEASDVFDPFAAQVAGGGAGGQAGGGPTPGGRTGGGAAGGQPGGGGLAGGQRT